MGKKLFPRLGLILFGLLLSTIFLELLIITVVSLYQNNQEWSNNKSFTSKHDITILALGESTTQAGGADAWPYQLESILNSQNLGYSFSVINKGVSGTTTEIILRTLSYNLEKYHPDIVISMMGINDAKNGAKVFAGTQNIKKSESTNEPQEPFWMKLHLIRLIRYFLSNLSATAFAQENKDLVNQGQTLLQQGKLEDAEAIINLLPSIPETKSQYLLKYNFLWNSQRYQDAFNLAKQAEKIWPDSQVYFHLGDGYQTTGDIENAFKYYNQALKMDPANSKIYLTIGSMYRNVQDYERAIPFFQEAVNKDENNQFYQSELIKTLGYAGKFDQAFAEIEKLLKLNPENLSVLWELESLYRIQNQSQKADEISKKILGVSSVTSINYHLLKELLQEQNIQLIAVQYPMRKLESLKEILGPDIIYVDNEESFKKAVAQDGYDKYFFDQYGGDFGHAKKEGNFILANNIAKVVENYITR